MITNINAIGKTVDIQCQTRVTH